MNKFVSVVQKAEEQWLITLTYAAITQSWDVKGSKGDAGRIAEDLREKYHVTEAVAWVYC